MKYSYSHASIKGYNTLESGIFSDALTSFFGFVGRGIEERDTSFAGGLSSIKKSALRSIGQFNLRHLSDLKDEKS